MKENYGSVPPQVPGYKPPKKKGNGKVYAICASIAICGVLASGGASYAAVKLAQSQAPQQTIIDSTVDKENGGSGNVNVNVIDVSDVVSKVRPSVVEITTEVVSSGNSLFQQYISEGAGSGVILSEDGYIVTNDHVIDGAATITVKTVDGQEYPAELIGTDPQTDIAVIKIDATGLTPAQIGSSDTIEVGEPAIAVGNPLGSLGGTVTTGVISAVGREITIENETMTLLQTDAAINPGNSGGGLFNVDGQLIGVVNAKQSASGIEGLGFAIPISDVESIIEELKTNGAVTSRPFLNVSLQDISENTYYTNGSREPLTPGVYIVQVVRGGAADQAGLEVGDRIISFDGEEVDSTASLKKKLRDHVVGDEVEMVIDRNGEEQTINITLQGKTNN